MRAQAAYAQGSVYRLENTQLLSKEGERKSRAFNIYEAVNIADRCPQVDSHSLKERKEI